MTIQSRKARNKAAERRRKRSLGLIPMEVWTYPILKDIVRHTLSQMNETHAAYTEAIAKKKGAL